jgi:hypothetical protein
VGCLSVWPEDPSIEFVVRELKEPNELAGLGAFYAAVASRLVLDRVDTIATDIGRLRRRSTSEADAWIYKRIAEGVEALDVMLVPSAAEFVQAGVPVDEALAAVGARDAHLRRLLGQKNGGERRLLAEEVP